MNNLFGEEIEKEEYYKTGKSKKHKTMQQIHGYSENNKCKNCKYFIRYNYHDKTYFKCELWHVSNSEATDIRANTTACGKFEKND